VQLLFLGHVTYPFVALTLSPLYMLGKWCRMDSDFVSYYL
jgi:hypothetical protein